MRFHWFLPTTGDGTAVRNSTVRLGAGGVTAAHRPATTAYLAQVARAAEAAGFDAALTPTGAGCPDPWITCAALARHTDTLRFLVAFRPGFVLPTLAAQQARTFQEVSDGRLLLNIVTGGDPVEQRAYGDTLGHDERYARTDEFLAVLRRSFAGGSFDFRGDHYTVQGWGDLPLEPAPEIYFGGASPAAERVAARRADSYLMWGEPPAMIAERVRRVRAAAAAQGRSPRFGVRLHVITRDTADEAWREAARLLEGMGADRVAAMEEYYARMDSTGQARMNALRTRGLTGDVHALEVSPNLWAGVGLVREGAGTALVGDHDQVAERLREYRAAGADEFILSGWPHLEEAYRVGEHVLPRLAAAPGAPADPAAVPAGTRP
ncbi:alkanesulfonate monooxygenase [Nocardiopsis flavescens]|uniref:Alkanesulfonate monooxygenase n=1 Tax=Nocardiopsis flavescens TaxID=758803 RepID=A0A1M6MHW2_9ACTN|nr:LLM class flavin-dependent oxidoreductase [Nocardiopsis flavescens]SHJ83065.1 alkanesulfonate monooxygenase [Nocardiopsis flavescens]